MGIIGVVAALTIPNLNSSTGNAEKVAKYKKIYAELNEAHNRAVAVYGPFDEWFNEDTCTTNLSCSAAKIRYFNRITEFMKLQKNCGISSGCMSQDAKYISGADWTFRPAADSANYPQAILTGGWSFYIYAMYKNYTYSSIYDGYKFSKNVGNIVVDLDGSNKGKNTWGIDIFNFVVTSEGIFPMGGGTLWTDNDLKEWCFCYGDCGAWILNTGNMDYINTNHTSISDAGKCNNNPSIQLSTTVTSCK